MKYLSWAAFYEGFTDSLYFDIIIPRLINDLIGRYGQDLVEMPDAPAIRLGVKSRSVEDVVREACESRGAFEIVFIHADTGGRNLERDLDSRSISYCNRLAEVCDFSPDRCITITPRHETEAWILADPDAIAGAIGYTGDRDDLRLPRNAREAEKLTDPKLVLKETLSKLLHRKRSNIIETIFPLIAQRQNLEELRRSDSFGEFEGRLIASLISLRYLPPP